MSQPTVSIIIPTHNREALLPRALDSVIAQTFSDWEIVLVDDGSTDDTESLVGRYQQLLGERLMYIRQSNMGCGGARNRGIEACRGRFVAFLDSDDEFLPNKLERQLALFDLRPELGLVYSDYAYVDLNGARHESVFDALCPLAREVSYEPIESGLCVCTESVFDVLLRGYFIATIVGLVRREVLCDAIRFSRDPSYAEEWLFYLRVTRACRSGFVDEPLCLHHFVQGSSARTDSHRNTKRLRKLLHEMRGAFDSLSSSQRSVIDHNLAAACRQLGYDACRKSRHGEAVRHFAESFWYEKRVDTARAALRSLGSAIAKRAAHRSRAPGACGGIGG